MLNCSRQTEEKPVCKACGCFVIEPYIECASCDGVFLCLPCFAQGIEFGGHENNHDYIVVKHDFPVITNGWSAAEELRLVDAVLGSGLGNWPDVARTVKTKTADECRKHYLLHYIENPKSPLPVLPLQGVVVPCNPVPYVVCEEPPRPAEGSTIQSDMSGYNAARGDFTTEYKNFAEASIADLEFQASEAEIETDMKLAVLDTYWQVLLERDKRKRLIRDYGLIQTRRALLWERQHHNTLGASTMEQLRPFMRLTSPEEWCKFIEGLSMEANLRSEISTLQRWRTEGIKYVRSGNVFEMMKERRKQYKPKPTSDIINTFKNELSVYNWLNKQASAVAAGKIPLLCRKSAPAIDVDGLPKSEKLSTEEKELCSTLRLLPGSYLNYKETLMNENKKLGGLRLKNARASLKIDVNKTRKLFNFLGERGYVDIIK